MNTIETHISKLGMTGIDKVTKLEGVITSLNFDLYGCVQYLLTPKAKDDGTTPDSHWYDVTRVTITDQTPVMDIPDFDAGYIAEGKKGCNAQKPAL